MTKFGIKTPKNNYWPERAIHWIGDTEHEAWRAFFTQPYKQELKGYRLPLAEAIEAYESLGYECVELELRETWH